MSKRASSGKLIVRSKEMIWEEEGKYDSKGSESKVVMLSDLLPIRSVGLHIEELAPGASSNIHKHSEAVIYVIKGKGYSEVQGKKIQWQEGDVLYIPPQAWHRHWNPSKTEPARFLGMYPRGMLLSTFGEFPLINGGKKTYAELKSEGKV